jgi:hypothetical protein
MIGFINDDITYYYCAGVKTNSYFQRMMKMNFQILLIDFFYTFQNFFAGSNSKSCSIDQLRVYLEKTAFKP